MIPALAVPATMLRWWTRSVRDPRFDLGGVAVSYWSVMHEGREAVLAQSLALGTRIPRDIAFGASRDAG